LVSQKRITTSDLAVTSHEEIEYIKNFSMEEVSPFSPQLPLKNASLKLHLSFIALDSQFSKEQEKKNKYFLEINMKKKNFKTKSTLMTKDAILEFDETCRFKFFLFF
jgi:hypothetical protein